MEQALTQAQEWLDRAATPLGATFVKAALAFVAWQVIWMTCKRVLRGKERPFSETAQKILKLLDDRSGWKFEGNGAIYKTINGVGVSFLEEKGKLSRASVAVTGVLSKLNNAEKKAIAAKVKEIGDHHKVVSSAIEAADLSDKLNKLLEPQMEFKR